MLFIFWYLVKSPCLNPTVDCLFRFLAVLQAWLSVFINCDQQLRWSVHINAPLFGSHSFHLRWLKFGMERFWLQCSASGCCRFSSSDAKGKNVSFSLLSLVMWHQLGEKKIFAPQTTQAYIKTVFPDVKCFLLMTKVIENPHRPVSSQINNDLILSYC